MYIGLHVKYPFF